MTCPAITIHIYARALPNYVLVPSYVIITIDRTMLISTSKKISSLLFLRLSLSSELAPMHSHS
jgi:hypothetical protein